MECSICFEDVSAATGKTEMACGHTYHFPCLVRWFMEQLEKGQDETCPCCRRVASATERFPDKEDSDEEEDEDYEEESDEEDAGPPYYEHEDEQLWLTRAELDNILKTTLGATGVPDTLWFHFFNPDGEDRLNPAIRLCFARGEVRTYSISQGGRDFTDDEWRAAVERYPEEPAAAAALPPPAPSLRITWQREPSGNWVRKILNPEQDEPASWGPDHPGPPPDDLTIMTSTAAKRIQAIWRGYRVRAAST